MRKIINAVLIAIFIVMGCGTESPNPSFRIMTFNIRYNNPADGENAWSHRKGLVKSVIQFHQANIFGVQEALKEQMSDLENSLPEFSWFGVGRDDGKEAGEYSAIFYKKDRFDLLEHDTFWLSETPDILGSMGWDAACVRIVTWGHFKDNISGKDFFHFNTHFDHRGEAARENSCELVVKKIKEIADETPAILTGDFNFPPSSPLYSILVKNRSAETDRVISLMRKVFLLNLHTDRIAAFLVSREWEGPATRLIIFLYQKALPFYSTAFYQIIGTANIPRTICQYLLQ